LNLAIEVHATPLGRKLDNMSKEEKPKTYKECSQEIDALVKDPEYNDWGARTQPNTGSEISPELFRMTNEDRKGWAELAGQLFSK